MGPLETARLVSAILTPGSLSPPWQDDHNCKGLSLPCLGLSAGL